MVHKIHDRHSQNKMKIIQENTSFCILYVKREYQKKDMIMGGGYNSKNG